MDDVNSRLTQCFKLVFPDLAVRDVPSASQESLKAWDSVAAITLVNVIEDEFQIQVDFDLLPELNSFDKIREYIAAQRQGV